MHTPLPLSDAKAILFDLDGVLTPTADVHQRAWGALFTDYFTSIGKPDAYKDDDYYEFIDGRPRIEGVETMLAVRGVTLPLGTPEDAPGNDTAWALGNRKNEFFNAELKEHGVAAYPGSKAFLDAVLTKGLDVAVVSSSKNAEPVLETADLRKHFEIVIDGLVAADLGIAGKPAPDTFIYAAQKLGFEPEQCVVLEDAHSGVSAGRAGNFGLVVGVDRGIGAAALIEAGADEVVTDLADLIPSLNHKNEI